MGNDDAGDFQPVNMVERQLIAAAHGTVEQQIAFERFILEEQLYVATPDMPAEGAVTLTKDATLKLLNVKLDDGRLATAVFTSSQRAAETFGEVGYAAIQGRALIDRIRDRPAILNPGHGYCVVWEPDNLARMLGLPSERTVERNTEVMLGSPANPPAEFIARLTQTFGAMPEVESAWLALAAWPREQTQSWYLDVRTNAHDHEAIRRALPPIVEGADLQGMPVDMIINPAGGAKGTGIVIKQGKRRGLLGRLFG